MADRFRELLKTRDYIIFDGAMGTMLQAAGMKMGETPEVLNITRPELLVSIAGQYYNAGSDVVYANTFGANRYKLEECGKSVEELVTAGIVNAKKARDTVKPDGLVALDVGPIGQLLEPTGVLSFEEAYDMYAEIVKAGAAAGADLVVFETMTDLLDVKAAVLAAKENSDLPIVATMTFEQNMRTFTGCSISAMALTLTGLGVTVQMLSGDTESFSYKLAGTAVNAGIAIGAIGTLIGWLGKLALAYKEVATMGAAAGLLSTAGIVGAGVVGIGAAVGAGTVGIYAAKEGLSFEDLVDRWTATPQSREEERLEKKKKFRAEQDEIAARQKEIDDARKAAEEASRLALNSFGGSDDKGKKAKGGKSEAEKQAEKALKELTKWQGKVNELAEDLQTKITEQTGSKLDIATASLTAELEKMNSTIENAKVAGVDNEALKSVQAQIDLYKKLKEEQNNRDWITEQHKLRMDNLQAEEDSQTRHISVINEMRALELERYKEKLQEELAATNLTEQEKLRLRQEFAAATQELQEAQATDLKASWDNALEYIKNKQFNQFETIKGGFDDILSTMTNFGQNMITEQKSFSEMADSLFKDLANSIMNTMLKVIMQGLVMNSIMSMFGMGGGGGFDLGGILNNPSKFSVGGTSYAGGSFMGKFAQGGYTGRGWALVGEEGPELLDLKTPGRVYTADQTRAALSGSAAGGTTKIIVQLENKSGTQLKASEQNTTFDGKNYVVSVLLEAVATNYMGTQNILRGALGTP